MDAFKFHTNTAMNLAHAAGTDNSTATGITEVAAGIKVVAEVTHKKDRQRTRLDVISVGYDEKRSELVVVAPHQWSVVRAVAVPLASGIGALFGSIATTVAWALLT